MFVLFIRLGSTSQQSHTREGGVEGAHVTNASPASMAPPPTDNVWEKRAEERESAEKERAAQQDALNQIRLQQQFPTVDKQSGEFHYTAAEWMLTTLLPLRWHLLHSVPLVNDVSTNYQLWSTNW